MPQLHKNEVHRNPTQEECTLALLRSRGQAWTPAPELAAISLQYCRVISCLRRRGIRIENRVEMKNGVKHGFYRLAEKNQEHTSLPPKDGNDGRPGGLFSAEELQRTARWADPEER